MPITLPASMEARRISTEKRPLFAVTFDGIPYTFGAGTGSWLDLVKFGDGFLFGDYNTSIADTLSVFLDAPPAGDDYIILNGSGAQFTAPGTVRIDSEEIYYTTRVGNFLWFLTRGYNGTTPASHAVGSPVYKILAFGDSALTTTTTVDTLKTPSGFAADVAPEDGRSSLGGVTVPIMVSDELLDVLDKYVLKGRKATVRAGFDTVSPSDWITVFTGVIDNIQQWGDGLGFDFELSDFQRFAKKQVFRTLSAKVLDDPLTAVATTINVDSTTDFPTSGYLRIDKELISYTGTTLTTFTGCTRGVLGTTADKHHQDSTATELFMLGHNHQVGFDGHPCDIALMILTSTGTGTNYDGVSTNYDVLPERHGVGVDWSLIDIETYQAIKSELTGIRLEFRLDKVEDAKAFLEKELYAPFNLYPVIKADGRLSLKLFEPPESSDDLPVIDDTVLVGMPSVNANFQRHANSIVWLFDHSIIDNEYLTQHVEDDTQSISRYKDASASDPISTGRFELVIKSRGLRTIFSDDSVGNAESIILVRSARYFTRYSDPPLTVSCQCFYEMFHVEPGDLVQFQTNFPIDPKKGRRGMGTYIMEVVSRNTNFDSGIMSFELLYTPFAGARYGVFAPVGIADYQGDGTQDAIEDTYVWIGTNGTITDSGSNPDDPYRYQ